MRNKRTETKTQKEESVSKPPVKEQNSVWKFLSSVKLTIFLLVFLAAGSIVGTLIPQNESPDLYIKKYGLSTYKVLDNLSFLDLYHSSWYKLLLALLALNLVVCTTDRLRHVWEIVFPRDLKINEKGILARPGERTLTYTAPQGNVKSGVTSFFSSKLGSIHEVNAGAAVILWHESGRLSRLGVFVVHLSIIFFYIAGIASSIGGFRTNAQVSEGQAISQLLLPGEHTPPYDLGFTLRLDKFEAEFYPTGEPKDYRSMVTVFENQKPVLQSIIRVNDPLSYKGLTFYQASYGRFPKALHLTVEDKSNNNTVQVALPVGQAVELPNGMGSIRSLNYEPDVMGMGPAVQLAMLSPRTGEISFWIFKKDPDFGNARDLPLRFIIHNVEEGYYSGLQIAKEPGIFFVWAGSILMVLGIAVTFFMSHKKLWAVIQGKGDKTVVTLGGQANKNKMGLESRLDKLYKELQEANITKG